jgi:hypothetical protein
MAMRSTDKDLLVAQASLGKIRYPNMNEKDLLNLVERSRSKISTRFVDMTNEFKPEVVPQHRQRHVYDLTANFQLRCQTRSGRYVLTVSIGARNVSGIGQGHKACLEEAKEKFRLHIRNSIRDAKHPLYTKFLEQVKVEVKAAADEDPEADVEHAKDIFRKFIGVQLGDSDSQLRKQFFKRVTVREVQPMKECKTCHKEKQEFYFVNNKGEMTEQCSSCRPEEVVAMPEGDEADETDSDDDDEDDEEEEADDE